MILPDILEPFRAEAQKLVAEEIMFSGPTYQVRFGDETAPIWVFLQLDHNDGVKDLFCGCDSCSETGACIHMASAIFAIFKGYAYPLHKRFEASPFYALCSALPSTSAPSCRQQGATLRWGSGAGSVLLKGPSEWMNMVKVLATRQELETEETSIKFSNLSEEEVQAWRQGIVSDSLRFELSTHSDLAKHLFMLSEKRPCHFRFEGDRALPSRLSCDFEEISCSFPLLGSLELVLDKLPPQRTTPRIEPYGGQTIKELSFDAKKNACTVTLEGEDIDLTGAIPIEGTRWTFLPGEAFVRKTSKKRIVVSSPEEVALFFDFDESVLSISYAIDVEEDRGLTVTPYVRVPHDLKGARFFDHWLWHKKFGFRRIRPLLFQPPESFVSVAELSDFCTAHRHWLFTIPGFAVHERPPREVVTYQVDSSQALCFHREVVTKREEAFKRLGAWAYVEGEGFFLREGRTRIPYDVPIPPHRVAEFIRKESEWLKEVPQFSAPHVPISGVGLDIRLVKKKIQISPVYQWENADFRSRAIFYDDMGYVPNFGFFPLPTLLAQHNFTRSYSAKDKEPWDRFFLKQLPELQNEFPCSIDPRLEKPQHLRLVCHGLEPQALVAALQSPTLWEARFFWESEKGKVAPDELLAAYRRGERFLPSDAGLLDLTEERFGWLSSICAPRTGDQYRLKAFDFLKIKAHDDFSFSPNIVSSTSTAIERLLHAVPSIPPDLSTLKSHLRPYQLHGVEWLWHLYLSGLSGLLCDDMGVGKTHQAMGLFSAVYADAMARGLHAPKFLIVCPASLLWHWRDKIIAALPHLKIVSHFGGNRSLDEFTEECNVFITTYGIWRSEAKVLHQMSFDVAVFDELQIAKNHVSQIWKALSQVRATMRLGLTGTPVENQLRELKAIFDLVLPGYLPTESLFREYYLRPIEREGADDRRNLLSRYVRPFLLRRRKQDVLPELPPKTEDLYVTELIGEQKELYRQVAARQAAPLIQQLRDEHMPIPFMHIFSLLSALKQICNHPAAYLRDTVNYTRYESGKWDTFVELLEEAQESGQKIVVFSQFLSMLDIIGSHLQTKNIGYAEIRGSTKDRGDEIDRFQNDPTCQVFLGSLQASGLGIDLTAGSVVIHYDRWWNAARENQATDRVHRIGQNRGVMVYKLMTAQTIEERIDRMITRKAQLFEDVISYDDHQVLKKLDRVELLELLEGLDTLPIVNE